jgi:hypothetical protein
MIHTFDGLVATKKIHSVYMQAKDLKLKHKTMSELLDTHTGVIKEYMSDEQVLYCPEGGEIVTYKTQSEREVLDLEKLKTLYPHIYEACLTVRPGNRVFLLK